MADSVGRDRLVDVLEVSTQSERIMTMDQWAKYFALAPHERPRILNVITLEISESSIGRLVKRPLVVRQLVSTIYKDITNHLENSYHLLFYILLLQNSSPLGLG